MESPSRIRAFRHVGAVVVVSLTALGFEFLAREATPAWTLGPPVPYAIGDFGTSTLLTNGRVLVAGGLQSPASSAVFDPATDTWSPIAPIPSPHRFHQAAGLTDGRVLAIGGATDTAATAAVDAYDPTAHSWAPVAPMHEARYGFVAAPLSDGRVLVVGGYASDFVTSAEVYDPATDTWTVVAPMNQSRWFPAATVLIDGRVLVTGGWRDFSEPPTPTAEIYDPVADTWTMVESMPVGRYLHAAVRLNDGRVLVAGGNDGDYSRASYVFDPLANSWSILPEMAIGRAGPGLALWGDGRVLVAGGVTANVETFGVENATSELFDPTTHTWSSAPTVYPRTGYVLGMLTTLPDGRSLLAGGVVSTPLSPDWQTTEMFGLNGVPTAVAGADQEVPLVVRPLTPVTLDGSASRDRDHDPLTYVWTEGSTTLASTAIAVVNLGVGTHTITLTVSDGVGGSATDTVVITVFDRNRAPIAAAGADQVVPLSLRPLTPVTLDGSASSDPDGDPVTYLWKEGSTTVASTATPTVNLGIGTHTMTLTVSDDLGGVATDTVVITVFDPLETLATCQSHLSEAQSTIEGLQNEIATLQEQGRSLRGQLDAAHQRVTTLETQVASLTGEVGVRDAAIGELEVQISVLEAQLASGAIQGAALAASVNAIEADLRTTFRNRAFTIPGATPLERFQRLSDAVLSLNEGRKRGIYVSLGGK